MGRIAIAPEPRSSGLTSFKSMGFDSRRTTTAHVPDAGLYHELVLINQSPLRQGHREPSSALDTTHLFAASTAGQECRRGRSAATGSAID